MVAAADFVLSALLVAVMVNGPAVVDENIAAAAVCPASVPPVVLHVTPALPTSFVTTAVNGIVCEVVIPLRLGLIATLTLPVGKVEVVAVLE
jgi:hypothetical protein